MNKLLILVFLVILTSCGTTQHLPRHSSAVTSSDSNALFERANVFIKDALKDTEYVVLYSSIESGEIKLKWKSYKVNEDLYLWTTMKIKIEGKEIYMELIPEPETSNLLVDKNTFTRPLDYVQKTFNEYFK
jgi:hypothetical protein